MKYCMAVTTGKSSFEQHDANLDFMLDYIRTFFTEQPESGVFLIPESECKVCDPH